MLCGFVLLFVLFLELLNMGKYFQIKKYFWTYKRGEKMKNCPLLGKVGEKHFQKYSKCSKIKKCKINLQFIISSVVHDIAVIALNF